MLILQSIAAFVQTLLLTGLAGFAAPAVDSSDSDGEQSRAVSGICSASSDYSRTGRQYARVTVSPRQPEYCIREKLGGEAPRGTPNCWEVAYDLGCEEIIDLD